MAFMTHRSGRRLALVLAMALASASALAQAEDPALRLGQPTRSRLLLDANNPRQVWGAVMKAVGAYDKAQKCWTLATGGRRFCMRPAKLATAALSDGALYLFAVSGHEYEPAQVTGGVVMFLSYTTSDINKGFRSDGVDGLYEFGARGAPPDDSAFKLLEVGPQTFAWEVVDGFTGTGSDVRSTTLIHAAGRFTPRKKVLANFISYEGNQSGCGMDTGITCSAREIHYTLKPGSGPLHDLEMKLTTRTGAETIFATDDVGAVITSGPVAIPFDPVAGTYKLPVRNMIEWLRREPAAP